MLQGGKSLRSSLVQLAFAHEDETLDKSNDLFEFVPEEGDFEVVFTMFLLETQLGRNLTVNLFLREPRRQFIVHIIHFTYDFIIAYMSDFLVGALNLMPETFNVVILALDVENTDMEYDEPDASTTLLDIDVAIREEAEVGGQQPVQ